MNKRELDAVIAESVLGYKFEVDKINGKARWIGFGYYGDRHSPPMNWKEWGYKIPPYSANFEATYEVITRLIRFGWLPTFKYIGSHGEWEVRLFHKKEGVAIYTKQSLPEAICKAALIAKDKYWGDR